MARNAGTRWHSAPVRRFAPFKLIVGSIIAKISINFAAVAAKAP